jgi:hypothetical protein
VAIKPALAIRMSIVGANGRTNMWREEIWIARVCVNQVDV